MRGNYIRKSLSKFHENIYNTIIKMGLDIHFYVEYKVNNEWVPHPTHVTALQSSEHNKFVRGGLEMGRDSLFFQFLMNSLSRGLPQDISGTIAKLHRMNDKEFVFGECYCSIEEYEESIVNYNSEMLESDNEEQYLPNESSFVKIILCIDQIAESMKAQKIRLIFWFDH